MRKLKYEIDPHNRIIINEAGRKSDLPLFRKVLEGRFKVGQANSLIYHVKAPLDDGEFGYEIPHQLKLKGIWSLTDNHDLRLTLDKWGRRTFGDELILEGDIIDAHKNALLFAVTTKSKTGTATTYVLKLEGAWQADENNRLTFRVKKESGKSDILTFDGIWELGENYDIIYRYKKSYSSRALKKTHEISFKGKWAINDSSLISYEMDRDTRSIFNFKTSLGIFEKDYIKYELGIALSDRPKPVRRVISLFGRWNIKRDTGITFEIRYEDRKVDTIIFGAQARLTANDSIRIKLMNEKNKGTGIELELERELLKGDGQAFLRLLKSQKEAAIYAGAAWGW